MSVTKVVIGRAVINVPSNSRLSSILGSADLNKDGVFDKDDLPKIASAEREGLLKDLFIAALIPAGVKGMKDKQARDAVHSLIGFYNWYADLYDKFKALKSHCRKEASGTISCNRENFERYALPIFARLLSHYPSNFAEFSAREQGRIFSGIAKGAYVCGFFDCGAQTSKIPAVIRPLADAITAWDYNVITFFNLKKWSNYPLPIICEDRAF